MAVPVSPSGRYVAALGTLTIPGDANPISGRVVVIENVVLSGGFSRPLRFCSAFDGHVTQPTDIVLAGASNTMIYDKVTEGATQPVHTAGDFAAGCPVPAE